MGRRLAAILAADVAGCSRLMERDEAGTLEVLKSRRRNILAPLLTEHHGRIVKLMGDGVLVEFGSAVIAVQCAVDLQTRMDEANAGLAEDRRILLRIGINLGDVIVEGGDLYGEGVNIAARLQAMAMPGGICLSQTIVDHVSNKVEVQFEDLGSGNSRTWTDQRGSIASSACPAHWNGGQQFRGRLPPTVRPDPRSQCCPLSI